MAEVALTQSANFKHAARELETDDDPERLKERLRKIATHKTAKERPE